jgi:short-subunit dehydrogenase
MGTDSGVVLVTGAGSGIGRQVALTLARRGRTVAGLDCRAEGLEGLERELAREQRAFAWGVADVTEADDLLRAVEVLAARLGPVDLLIASAGVAGATPAEGMRAAAVARIIGVNLIGASNTIAAVLPGMLARRHGHVVAISSLASFRGLPGQMGYCASKAGLNALMQSLWLDVKGHGVQVTTVCPGHTRTPQSADMFKDECLMSVERTAREILRAIDGRKRFHAFPWLMVRQLRMMRVLPARLQEWLLHRAMKQIRKDPGPV